MDRGKIKVVINRSGIAKIYEELDDKIKIYSAEEWKKELEKRNPKLPTQAEVVIEETNPQVEDSK